MRRFPGGIVRTGGFEMRMFELYFTVDRPSVCLDVWTIPMSIFFTDNPVTSPFLLKHNWNIIDKSEGSFLT